MYENQKIKMIIENKTHYLDVGVQTTKIKETKVNFHTRKKFMKVNI